MHLLSPFAVLSITFQLLQFEGPLVWWHDKDEAPRPYIRRAGILERCTLFEPALNKPETLDVNNVFSSDRDLNKGETSIRVVDD